MTERNSPPGLPNPVDRQSLSAVACKISTRGLGGQKNGQPENRSAVSFAGAAGEQHAGGTAARLYGVGKRSVYDWCKRGVAIKVGAETAVVPVRVQVGEQILLTVQRHVVQDHHIHKQIDVICSWRCRTLYGAVGTHVAELLMYGLFRR